MEKEYDVLVVGPVSLDHNIDYLGNERSEVGGAVVASGWAAAGSGAKAAIFCKLNPEEADVNERFEGPEKNKSRRTDSDGCNRLRTTLVIGQVEPLLPRHLPTRTDGNRF